MIGTIRFPAVSRKFAMLLRSRPCLLRSDFNLMFILAVLVLRWWPQRSGCCHLVHQQWSRTHVYPQLCRKLLSNGFKVPSFVCQCDNSDLEAGDSWIGLYYDNGWRWVDGSPLDYTHWKAPYPAAQGVGSACAYLVREGESRPFTSYWCNWSSCNLQFGAICSLPAADG